MANASIVSGLTLVLALGVAAVSQAQPPQPATEKFYANVNVGANLASRTVDSTATKTIYKETAVLTASTPVGAGLLVDFGGGYRVWNDVFAGLLVSWFGDTAVAATTTAVPDPIFFNRPANITGQFTGLSRSEVAVAPHLVWAMTLTDKIDLAAALGVSFVRLSQDLPASINDPPAGTQAVTVNAASESGSGAGPFAQVDFIYNWKPRYGFGGFVRFAGAKVDLDSAPDSNAGGMQAGGGIRFRF